MSLTTRRTSAGPITKYTFVKHSTTRGHVEAWTLPDSVSLIAGVALANASQAGIDIIVQEIPGVEAGILSDGYGAIEPGDLLVPSPTIPGRVRVGTADAIGVATASAGAIVNADLTMIWRGPGGSSGASLPDQDGHDGEFLTTSGVTASWGPVGVGLVVYDTVDDLRAADAPDDDSTIIQVLGLDVAGDGGGGSWYWDDVSTDIDDGALTVKPNSVSGAGRWKRLYDRAHVSAAWFPGDDLGEKINAADTALGATAITIEVPPGDYTISTQIRLGLAGGSRKLILGDGTYDNTMGVGDGPPIVMYDNTEIVAARRWGAVVLETVNRAGGVTGAIADYNTFTDNAQDGNHNIAVRRLAFGRKASTPDGVNGTVQFGNSHNVEVSDCYFLHTNGFCMVAGGSAVNGYFANGVRFLNNTMIEAGTQNIAVVNAKHIEIRGNYMLSGGAGSPPAAGSTFIDLETNTGLDHLEDFDISYNIIDVRGGYPANGYAGIQVGGGGDLARCQNGTISYNKILGDNTTNATAISMGLLRNVRVQGNTITGFSQSGIDVGTSKEIEICDNQLINVLTANDAVGTGIELINTQRCTVHDNTFINRSGNTNWEPGMNERDEAGDPPAENYFWNNRFLHVGDGNALHDVKVQLVAASSRVWNTTINSDTFDSIAGVPTAAALQAAMTPSTRGASLPAAATLLGVGAVYDSQPTVYPFDPASTEDDNGITVLKPSSSTTTGRFVKAPLWPKMTTSERDALALTSADAGRIAIFNTTLNKVQVWDGAGWNGDGSLQGAYDGGQSIGTTQADGPVVLSPEVAQTVNVFEVEDTSGNPAFTIGPTGSALIDESADLTLRRNALGVAVTPLQKLRNETAATSGVPVQVSPALEWKASGWDSDDNVARECIMRLYVLPKTGSTVYFELVLTKQLDGGAETRVFGVLSLDGLISGAVYDAASGYIDPTNLLMVSSNGSKIPQIASASSYVVVDSSTGVRIGTGGTPREFVVTLGTGAGNPGYIANRCLMESPVGSVLTISANVITPLLQVHHVNDNGLIKTITVPDAIGSYGPFTGTIVLIPDQVFTWDTTGNIALAGTAVVGKALHMTYDGTSWYPSYV